MSVNGFKEKSNLYFCLNTPHHLMQFFLSHILKFRDDFTAKPFLFKINTAKKTTLEVALTKYVTFTISPVKKYDNVKIFSVLKLVIG